MGEPGIGKTTVWREATDMAAALGATVLVARPAQAEQRLVFAGLADLLSGVPEACFDELPGPQRDALAVALLRVRSDRPPNRRLVGTALLSVLRALAGDGPVVVAVDDLHWLDGPSAAALEFALRRLVGEPVRTVASVRSADAEGSWLIGAGRELKVERLELGPLSLAALHRILAESLARTFPRPVLVRIAEACGGNPLYALEVARGLDRSGEDVVR